ncbi:MAG: hypothetical protein O7E51_09585, partial [Acidobacteria bacterium]|nr:hypothetical protein [Acidobacteriota bacterium]
HLVGRKAQLPADLVVVTELAQLAEQDLTRGMARAFATLMIDYISNEFILPAAVRRCAQHTVRSLKLAQQKPSGTADNEAAALADDFMIRFAGHRGVIHSG